MLRVTWISYLGSMVEEMESNNQHLNEFEGSNNLRKTQIWVRTNWEREQLRKRLKRISLVMINKFHWLQWKGLS
jgi:hypothetical protein